MYNGCLMALSVCALCCFYKYGVMISLTHQGQIAE